MFRALFLVFAMLVASGAQKAVQDEPQAANCKLHVEGYGEKLHAMVGEKLYGRGYVYDFRDRGRVRPVQRMALAYIALCIPLTDVAADLAKPFDQRKVRVQQN